MERSIVVKFVVKSVVNSESCNLRRVKRSICACARFCSKNRGVAILRYIGTNTTPFLQKKVTLSYKDF